MKQTMSEIYIESQLNKIKILWQIFWACHKFKTNEKDCNYRWIGIRES